MAPARVGEGGGASGGVAVFARKGMGLRFPVFGSHVVEEGRAVAAFCEPPGHRPFLAVSAYLIDGQGTKEPNMAIMRKISHAVARHGPNCVSLIGADFQCGPDEVDASGFPASVGGRVFASGSRRGTFRSGSAASHLDYFVVGGGLAEAVDSVDLAEASGVKGHVPVQLSFRPRAVALRTLAVRQPPPLGIERVFGPLPAPPDWANASRAASDALDAARAGSSRGAIQAALDDAYRKWCSAAEIEIANASGEHPKKWGLRGLKPKLKWSSVLPETSCSGGAAPAAIASTNFRESPAFWMTVLQVGGSPISQRRAASCRTARHTPRLSVAATTAQLEDGMPAAGAVGRGLPLTSMPAAASLPKSVQIWDARMAVSLMRRILLTCGGGLSILAPV